MLKHSGATLAEVHIQRSPHQLRISIADDGAGAPATAQGFGLHSLRARAQALGGQVTSGSSAAGGFELTATLPLTPLSTTAGSTTAGSTLAASPA